MGSACISALFNASLKNTFAICENLAMCGAVPAPDYGVTVNGRRIIVPFDNLLIKNAAYRVSFSLRNPTLQPSLRRALSHSVYRYGVSRASGCHTTNPTSRVSVSLRTISDSRAFSTYWSHRRLNLLMEPLLICGLDPFQES
jgi:hypothetical protein